MKATMMQTFFALFTRTIPLHDVAVTFEATMCVFLMLYMETILDYFCLPFIRITIWCLILYSNNSGPYFNEKSCSSTGLVSPKSYSSWLQDTSPESTFHSCEICFICNNKGTYLISLSLLSITDGISFPFKVAVEVSIEAGYCWVADSKG